MNRARLADRYQSDGLAVTPGPVLVVRLYERLQRDIATARSSIDGGQIEAAHRALVNAQEIAFELRIALDLDAWEGAPQLAALYDHLIGRLTAANATKSVPLLDECAALVAPLVDAWQEASVAMSAGAPVSASSGFVASA